ncbi:MAG: peptide ABC transporter substrate-binding protein [Gemmatimonadota bacterium]
MRSRRTASIAALALAVACGGPQRPADVVVYASGTDLESANPLITIHPLSRQIQRHVLFVTLTRLDSALVQQPYLARRWMWNANRSVLTMHLEPGVHWHDGERTTARDVRFTLLRGRDPRTGYPRSSDLAAIDSVLVPSDSVVVVRFRAHQRDVPAVFAELPIVPEHLLRSVAPADLRRAGFSTAPVGNGPFRFVRRVAGQRWEFARNDSFPSSMGGPPRIRSLVVAVVDEPTTKFAGLAAGELDVAGISASMADLARRDPMIAVMDYPVLFSTGIVFNTHRAPFDDVRVRRAIGLSIDRQRIVAAALAGFGTPASGPVPPENPLAANEPPAHEPALADALLDSAGWRRGTDGWRARGVPLDVELLTVGSGDNAVEQLVQADLAARGIRLRVRPMELGAFLARARSHTKDFDVLITGVPGDLALSYVGAMFESAQRGGALDYASYRSATLDALFGRVRQAVTGIELRNRWLNVQRQLALELPVAWIYHSRGLQGVSARMRGVVFDLRGELATVTHWTTDGSPPDGRSVARR